MNWQQLATPPETLCHYALSIGIAQADWHYGRLTDAEFIAAFNCMFHLAWEDKYGYEA